MLQRCLMRWFVLSTLVFTSGVLGAFLGDRSPPIVVRQGEIVPDPVSPGQLAEIRWKAILVRKSCTRTVRRYIVGSDNEIRILDENDGAVATGPDSISKKFLVPFNTPLGRARYRATATFVCNPVHEIWPILVSTPEVPFDVVAP